MGLAGELALLRDRIEGGDIKSLDMKLINHLLGADSSDSLRLLCSLMGVLCLLVRILTVTTTSSPYLTSSEIADHQSDRRTTCLDCSSPHQFGRPAPRVHVLLFTIMRNPARMTTNPHLNNVGGIFRRR